MEDRGHVVGKHGAGQRDGVIARGVGREQQPLSLVVPAERVSGTMHRVTQCVSDTTHTDTTMHRVIRQHECSALMMTGRSRYM